MKRISRNIKEKKYIHNINMTPMVDVMMVLLAVFMITAPLLTSGIDLRLPIGGKANLSGVSESINIDINKKGEIYLAKQKITINNLMKKLNEMKKENPKLSIVLSGDISTAYGNVIKIMGKLKDAGFSKVGLKTAPPRR